MTLLENIPETKLSRDSIYLHLSHRGDQQLLQSFLRENYHIVAGNGEWKDVHFDLLILDIPQLIKYRKDIVRLKKSHYPEIIPLITLVDRKYQKLTKEITELPDDLLQLPVSPEIFIARVKAMLRIRGLSKAVESKNRSLQRKNEQLKIYHKAIQSTHTGIVFTDPSKEDNPIVFFNNGFSELTGYERGEILGKNCRFLQGEDREQEGLVKLREDIKQGRSANVLLRNYRKDGSKFWNELRISPVTDKNGQLEYFVGVQNNVTQLVEAKEQMEEMLEQKQTLLQEIHHRVKNNLAVISGLIELQSMGYANEETVEVLAKTRSRITSIAKVHELLYNQDNLNEIDFKQYVKNLSGSISSIHSDVNGNIDIDLVVDAIRISIDQAVPLGLLLNELMSNSVEHGYTPDETPKISLKITSDGDDLVIDYRDFGSGLEEGVNLKKSGNFGMFIVRTLLRQLNAKWDYRSGSGKGMQFTCRFSRKRYGGPAKLMQGEG